MALRKLKKPEWRPFCDAMSRIRAGKRAEIEVASLSLGDQIEAEWLPLIGIVYLNREARIAADQALEEAKEELQDHSKKMALTLGGGGGQQAF